MNSTIKRPELLASYPDAIHAAMVVGVLRERGVRAHTTGDFTATFQSEAPGEVQILVDHADLPMARQMLAEIVDAPEPFDWSQVDCGDDSPIENDQVAPPAAASVQFNVATILVVQGMVALITAIIAILSRAQVNDLAIGFVEVVFGVLVLCALIVATVNLAGNLQRINSAWRLIGMSGLTSATVVLLLMVADQIATALGINLFS